MGWYDRKVRRVRDLLFDKFHIMRHLGEALDEVRKSEYRRLADRDRRYIKGTEIHAAVALGEPDARRQTSVEGAVCRQ